MLFNEWMWAPGECKRVYRTGKRTSVLYGFNLGRGVPCAWTEDHELIITQQDPWISHGYTSSSTPLVTKETSASVFLAVLIWRVPGATILKVRSWEWSRWTHI